MSCFPWVFVLWEWEWESVLVSEIWFLSARSTAAAAAKSPCLLLPPSGQCHAACVTHCSKSKSGVLPLLPYFYEPKSSNLKMCRSGERRVGLPRLLSTAHLWGGAVLRNWGRTDLQVPESWGGRAVLTESSLCSLSTAHYSLVVSLITGHSSKSPFWASLSNGTPIWRKGVHKRDYLCTVPWSDGPRRLFEQLLGFPVLSPAYEDKEKIPHQNRCCAMRLSKRRRILCSPRPRMFSSIYTEKCWSSLSWFTLLLYKPPSAALTDLIVVRDRKLKENQSHPWAS